MAILRIFRPALACLLLLLALSQEAPQDALLGAPQDAPQEALQEAPQDAKKGVKCKNPKVNSTFLFERQIFSVLFVRDTRETTTTRAATSTFVSRPRKNRESGLSIRPCKSHENDRSPFY